MEVQLSHCKSDEARRLILEKLNRHVVIALRHMGLQDDALTKKIESLTKERDDLRASIKALNAE
jgi:cell division protein FtsB